MLKLFCFGLGYTSLNLAKSLDSDFWSVVGTSRSAVKAEELKKLEIQVCNFKDVNKFSNGKFLSDATHILISAPPIENGDPVLRLYTKTLCSLKNCRMVVIILLSIILSSSTNKINFRNCRSFMKKVNSQHI